MSDPTYLAPVRDEIARLRAAVALLSDTLARRSDALNRTGRDNDHLRATIARVEKVATDCERMGRTSIDEQNREWLPAFAQTLRAALADPTSPTAIREPK